ncbi:MAG: nucleoside-diphosphate kinase [Patescibacteria group bacterium]|uniref:nucleoside-diphosphate kinase n=1 Tax=candidate division WWE3 bacterium TaxID=2053526 RepID=A0A955J250_UNCKA|nr:nucleoside-diphosphate kinase [candidate division WWE3 bacterium]
MNTEKTLVLMKPDAVKRGVVGEILHRFERAGLKMVAVKLVQADEVLAANHYPDDDSWKAKVGGNTLKDCEKYNVDVIELMGTDDPIEIGNMVKEWNKDFLKSGPVLAIVFQGIHAVERVRSLVGHTIPALAIPGSIRGDFSLDSALFGNVSKRTVYNLIHASGSVDEAKHEISMWFNADEIVEYKRVHDDLYSY